MARATDKSRKDRSKSAAKTEQQPKVYRSMAEIRRAFYPNAEREPTASRRARRVQNGVPGVIATLKD
jgi:hypothetical protein